MPLSPWSWLCLPVYFHHRGQRAASTAVSGTSTLNPLVHCRINDENIRLPPEGMPRGARCSRWSPKWIIEKIDDCNGTAFLWHSWEGQVSRKILAVANRRFAILFVTARHIYLGNILGRLDDVIMKSKIFPGVALAL
jgi:hypothetical protein